MDGLPPEIVGNHILPELRTVLTLCRAEAVCKLWRSLVWKKLTTLSLIDAFPRTKADAWVEKVLREAHHLQRLEATTQVAHELFRPYLLPSVRDLLLVAPHSNLSLRERTAQAVLHCFPGLTSLDVPNLDIHSLLSPDRAGDSLPSCLRGLKSLVISSLAIQVDPEKRIKGALPILERLSLLNATRSRVPPIPQHLFRFYREESADELQVILNEADYKRLDLALAQSPWLIDAVFSVRYPTGTDPLKSYTLLDYAAVSNSDNGKMAEYLLERHRANPNFSLPTNILYHAVDTLNEALIRFVLRPEFEMNINLRVEITPELVKAPVVASKYWMTPLIFLINNWVKHVKTPQKYLAILRLLLERGAEPFSVVYDYMPPFSERLAKSPLDLLFQGFAVPFRIGIINELLKYCTSLKGKANTNTWLASAIGWKDLDLFDRLVQAGLSIEEHREVISHAIDAPPPFLLRFLAAGISPANPVQVFVSLASRGRVEVARMMLERDMVGRRVLKEDPKMLAWLFEFAEWSHRVEHVRIVEALIKHEIFSSVEVVTVMKRAPTADILDLALNYKNEHLVVYLEVTGEAAKSHLTPMELLRRLLQSIHFPNHTTKHLWKKLAERALRSLSAVDQKSIYEEAARSTNFYMTAVFASVLGQQAPSPSAAQANDDLMVDEVVIFSPGKHQREVSKVRHKVL